MEPCSGVYVPPEIVNNILTFIPLDVLFRFRLVSLMFKSFIDTIYDNHLKNVPVKIEKGIPTIEIKNRCVLHYWFMKKSGSKEIIEKQFLILEIKLRTEKARAKMLPMLCLVYNYINFMKMSVTKNTSDYFNRLARTISGNLCSKIRNGTYAHGDTDFQILVVLLSILDNYEIMKYLKGGTFGREIDEIIMYLFTNFQYDNIIKLVCTYNNYYNKKNYEIIKDTIKKWHINPAGRVEWGYFWSRFENKINLLKGQRQNLEANHVILCQKWVFSDLIELIEGNERAKVKQYINRLDMGEYELRLMIRMFDKYFDNNIGTQLNRILNPRSRMCVVS